jgi:hypothetical protein
MNQSGLHCLDIYAENLPAGESGFEREAHRSLRYALFVFTMLVALAIVLEIVRSIS